MVLILIRLDVSRHGIVFVNDFGPDMMETIPYTNYWYYIVLPISGALPLFSLKNIFDAFSDGTSHKSAIRWTEAMTLIILDASSLR